MPAYLVCQQTTIGHQCTYSDNSIDFVLSYTMLGVKYAIRNFILIFFHLKCGPLAKMSYMERGHISAFRYNVFTYPASLSIYRY